MIRDPIVEEVHRIREELLAEFNGDLHALAVSVQRETEEARRAGQVVVPPTPRPPRTSIAPRSSVKKVG